MRYLLIEEKAWQELQAKGRRAIEKIRLLERHFNLVDGGDWLDNTDVCLRLNISKRTLQYYRDSGTLPYAFIGKKCYYKAAEKVLLGDDVVSRETVEYKELIQGLAEIERMADKVVGNVKPSLLNERYFSTEEIMAHFHISRRALQNYRDTGVIPYTTIGGVMLYPETKIREVLEGNYYKPTVFGKIKE